MTLYKFYCEYGWSDTYDSFSRRYWVKNGRLVRRCWNPFRRTEVHLPFIGFDEREKLYKILKSKSLSGYLS